MEPWDARQEQLWRRHERTGRPPGTPAVLDRIEILVGRLVGPAKRGPKRKRPEN